MSSVLAWIRQSEVCSRQAVATLAILALLVTSTAGAVLVATSPAAAQAEDGSSPDGPIPIGGNSSGDDTSAGPPAPTGGSNTSTGDTGNDTTSDTTSDTGNETTSDTGNSTGNDTGSDTADAATPTPTGTGAGSTPETGSTGGSNNSTNSTNSSGGGGGSSGSSTHGGDSGLFSITIDPVQILADATNSWFMFWLDLSSGLMEFLTERQYPTMNGEFTLGFEFDSELMQTLNDWWIDVTLPLGALLGFIFYLVLIIAEGALSSGETYTQTRQARKEAPAKIFAIFFSWLIGAFLLFVASFAIDIALPADAAIAPNTAAMQGQAAGAGWGLILVWFLGGFLLAGLALTFFLTWVGLYIFLPGLPVFMALSIPKVWILNDLASSFENVLEMFPTAAFFPLPSAMVFGIGYPVLNELQGMIPGPAQWGAVPVYGIGVVIIWFLALAIPVWMFWVQSARPLSGLATGALGAGVYSHLSKNYGNGGGGGSPAPSGLTPGSTGSTAGSPTSGHALASGPSSSQSPSGIGSGATTGSAMGSGSSASTLGAGTQTPTTANANGASAPNDASALPNGSGAPQGQATPTGQSVPGTAASPNPEPDDGSSPHAIDEAMPGPIPVDEPTATPVESQGDLPDQEYRFGYFDETGEDATFKQAVQGARPPSLIQSQMYDRTTDAYETEIYARGENDGVFYDVESIAGGSGSTQFSEAEQTAESRQTINDIRGM